MPETPYADAAKWLEEHRPRYNEAVSKLQDEQWVRKMIDTLQYWMQDVMGYNPVEHHERVAVHIVAQAKVRLSPLFEDFNLVKTFEENKQQYEEAMNNLEKLRGEGRFPDLAEQLT